MKHNAICIARRSARVALLSNVRNAFHASAPWAGLDSLNAARALRCIGRKQHSSRRNIDHVGCNLLSLFDDTIYALSTAPGRAGIAIIRISGPACLDVCP